MKDASRIESGAEAWLAQLRRRMVAVAARRVPAADVEDVVQDALRVVAERGVGEDAAVSVEGLPGLAWCFQVLRNTIGNYYQKSRTRRALLDRAESAARHAADPPVPLDSLEANDAARAILEAIESFGPGDCRRYLASLAGGTSPAELAHAERIEAPVLYRRIYRCRHRLRAALIERGILA